MKKYPKIDYTKVELPEKLLTSFAKALAPEIRKFYDSDEGKAYFEKWLAKHSEYDERTPDATASDVSGCRKSPATAGLFSYAYGKMSMGDERCWNVEN